MTSRPPKSNGLPKTIVAVDDGPTTLGQWFALRDHHLHTHRGDRPWTLGEIIVGHQLPQPFVHHPGRGCAPQASQCRRGP